MFDRHAGTNTNIPSHKLVVFKCSHDVEVALVQSNVGTTLCWIVFQHSEMSPCCRLLPKSRNLPFVDRITHTRPVLKPENALIEKDYELNSEIFRDCGVV